MALGLIDLECRVSHEAPLEFFGIEADHSVIVAE
jgi:hypothetical protein